MKVLSSQQLQLVDKASIISENIQSWQLMERASAAFTNRVSAGLDKSKPVLTICGPGNNGGDGLCIARMLFQKGFIVTVAVFPTDNTSADFDINLQRIRDSQIPVITIGSDIKHIVSEYAVIIDAIFGTGLNRSPEGLYATVIEAINTCDATCISVDVPSGFSTDGHFEWHCVQADYCLTFETPKLGYFFPENYKYLRKWEIQPIGLDPQAIAAAVTSDFFLTAADLAHLYTPRNTFDHKGTFGHALLIAGSPGMCGAALLSGLAALKTGCGLVTIANDTPQFLYPELMFIPTDKITAFITSNKIKRIGIGPGLSVNHNLKSLFKTVLSNTTLPLVIDADALNIIAENKSLLTSLPANSILTPHPGEFERLFGHTANSFKRLELQRAQSIKLQLIIIYKTAFTCITLPDGTAWFNSTGNPGMASGGSGDVLTGIITSLLAQGYTESDAAKLGVYLHGLAGDMALEALQQIALTASDIIHFIPKAMRKLFR